MRRKIIAQRLLESKLSVPHYYLRGHADLTTVNGLRAALKEAGTKVRAAHALSSAALCGLLLRRDIVPAKGSGCPAPRAWSKHRYMRAGISR